MNEEMNRDDAFAERVAKPLRATEQADAGFEARVMSAVLAERGRAGAAARRQPWLLRPYTLRLSPLAGLVFAAGFSWFVIATASILRVARSGEPSAMAGAQGVDTIRLVRFVLADSQASSVAVVGAFNHWQKSATPLHRTAANGVWSVTVPLRPGRHEYAFIVTRAGTERWMADPLGETLHDDYGTESSVISLDYSGS